MVAIDIRVDGVSIVDDVVYGAASFTSQADGQPGPAEIRVRDKGHDYPPDYLRAGRTLECYIAGKREWDGWVFSVRREWAFDVDDTTNPQATPRFWVVRGYDRNILFTKRFLYRVDDPADDSGLKDWPAETIDKEALEYALQHYVDLTGDDLDISSGIRQVASPGPYEKFTLGNVGSQFGVLFDDAAKITGAVFWIGPDRVIYSVNDRTVTAPFALSDVPGNPVGSKGYREPDAALEAADMANHALVWGASVASSEIIFGEYKNQDSIDEHGLWQWSDLYIGAALDATVERRAQTYVEGSASHRRGHGQDVPVVACTIFEPGLRVGHVVDFHSHVYAYNEALPIRRMTMTFPTPTDVRYDLELTIRVDAPFARRDPWGEDDIPRPYEEIFDLFPPNDPDASVHQRFATAAQAKRSSSLSGLPGSLDDYGYPWNSVDPFQVPGLPPAMPQSPSANGFSGSEGTQNTSLKTVGIDPQWFVSWGYPQEAGWVWNPNPPDDGTPAPKFIASTIGEGILKAYVRTPIGGSGPLSEELALFLVFDLSDPNAGVLHQAAFQTPDFMYFKVSRLLGHAGEATGQTYFASLPESQAIATIGGPFAFYQGNRYVVKVPAEHVVSGNNWWVISPAWSSNWAPTTATTELVDVPDDAPLTWTAFLGTDTYALALERLYRTGRYGTLRSKFRFFVTDKDYVEPPQMGWGLVDAWGGVLRTPMLQDSTFVTAYPYQPGSLEVRFEGQFLRPGVDVIEVDPATGKFRVNDTRDLSGRLYVRYMPFGAKANDWLGMATAQGGVVYRPSPVLQYGWGTRFDGYNCGCACSAMALDRHTLGGTITTPPEHRAAQSDQSGGVDLFDIKDAWSDGWGKTFVLPGVHSWSFFASMIEGGHGAIVQGRYDALPARLRFTDFLEEHAIYVNERYDDGSFYVIDPLHRLPVVYSESELRAYGESVSWSGPNQISAGFTRATGIQR